MPVTVWIAFAGWIVQSIIAFVAYLFGLSRLPAGTASILAMSEIAFVSLYAYTLLSERLSWVQIFGVALVVGGVCLLVQRQTDPSHQTETVPAD
jgi:drug/metabolite transporter (DMT)-like permease